jgi:hypothetical protein
LLPYTLDALGVQLAEVKSICSVLFKSKVQALESVQRLAISQDDPAGSPDYLTDRSVTTNAFATFTPYRVIFRAFSAEFGNVLNSLVTTPEFIIVRTVSIEPTEATAEPGGPGGGLPMVQPGMNPLQPIPVGANPAMPLQPGRPLPPGGLRPPVQPAAPVSPKPVAVLQEKAFRVTMLVEIVKSKSAPKGK